MFNPLISIIIPVYNGSKYLKEAIDSALAQAYQNIEVIVVNDGSTDNSEEIIKSYGTKVRYFKKENGGVSTALNLGIKEAKGEYISWLSHDDVYEVNKIEVQVKALTNLSQEKRDKTILFSNYRIIDGQSKVIETCPIHLVHDIEKFSNHLYPVIKGLVFGCTLLIPKRCFFEYGLFDVKRKTSQDTEMWMRLFPKYSILFQKEYLFLSRRHLDQGTNSSRAKEESNDLWCSIINNLDEKDKIFFDGTLEYFYFSTYKQMNRVGYKIAANYAWEKLNYLNKSPISILKCRIIYLFNPFFSKVNRIFRKLI